MKKTLALILAALMLMLTVGCTPKDNPTPAPDNEIEQNETVNPDEVDADKKDDTFDKDTANKVALLLEELRSRPLYTEVETIENDRCYVIRGYFSGTPDGTTDDIFVVYKYGGTRNLYSFVYPYFSVVDSIGFSEEKDYVLTVKGRVLSEDKESYTDATAEINIYSYEKDDTNVPGKPPDEWEKSKKRIRSMLQWDDPRAMYSIYAYELVSVPDTFSEKASEYLESYSKIEEDWHARPALLWYLAQEMDLTREDIEKYFAAFDSVYAELGENKVPENIYDGIMADTLEESMQLLKSDYAFYNDGKLYNIYSIEDMILNDTLTFDITDSAYDEVWKNISDFWETQPYCNLRVSTYLLIRERAHDPVKRLYFFYHTPIRNTWSTSYRFRPDTDYYSILDCDTYEAGVSSMNGRYALVHDGTYFIYDYLSGEKVCDIPFSPDEYHVEFIEFGSKDLPRYLNVGKKFVYDGNCSLMYDIEKQEFVSDEEFFWCVIPLATDLLCKTVESDGKYITTAYRTETLEEVLSVEGHIYSAEIDMKTVLAVKDSLNSNEIIAFYDTDGNELTGLDEYKTYFTYAPWGNHIIYKR